MTQEKNAQQSNTPDSQLKDPAVSVVDHVRKAPSPKRGSDSRAEKLLKQSKMGTPETKCCVIS
jgi:hypothetical protein